MLLQQNIDTTRSDALAEQVQQFLDSGGAIQRLPILRRDVGGLEWTRSLIHPEAAKPRTIKDVADKHCRKKHPGGDTTKASQVYAEQQKAKRAEQGIKVRELCAQGCRLPDIAKALGISTKTVVLIRAEPGLSKPRVKRG